LSIRDVDFAPGAQAINRFIAETNGDPKPYVCTADPHRVIEPSNETCVNDL
jgi:hypothetical protein